MQQDHIPKKFNLASAQPLSPPQGFGPMPSMLIYRHWAIMVYSEKLLNIVAMRKRDNHYTKKAYIGFALKFPILRQGQ